jgi:hypothetical protein
VYVEAKAQIPNLDEQLEKMFPKTVNVNMERDLVDLTDLSPVTGWRDVEDMLSEEPAGVGDLPWLSSAV